MFHVKHHIKIRQSWLQTTSRRQLKSFSVQQFFKNAAEVWASSPHLRSKSKLHYEIKQTSKKQSEKSQLPLKSKGCNEIQGFRGNCDSQGKLGMCPSLAEPDSDGFPRSNFEMFPVKHFVATVPPEQLQDIRLLLRFHKAGRSCSPRLEKLSLFSPPLRVPKGWHGDFAACGQRSGLLALNLASIFEKLLDQKTFRLPAARNFPLVDNSPKIRYNKKRI